MPKGWGGNSVVGLLPGTHKVLAAKDPTAGSWGDVSLVKALAA